MKAGGNAGALMRLPLDQLAFAPVFISSEWSRNLVSLWSCAVVPACLPLDQLAFACVCLHLQ